MVTVEPFAILQAETKIAGANDAVQVNPKFDFSSNPSAVGAAVGALKAPVSLEFEETAVIDCPYSSAI